MATPTEEVYMVANETFSIHTSKFTIDLYIGIKKYQFKNKQVE